MSLYRSPYEAYPFLSDDGADLRCDFEILTDRIALSASVGSHYTGGEATNRFNLTTGAATCGGPGNWAHLNNALVFELSPNPPTGDAPLTATLAAAVLSAAGAAALLLRKRNRA